MALTEDQVAVIKSTIPVVQQYGDAITKTFYHNMLDANPDLQNIFNITNQRNGEQPRALAGSLVAYASNIDNLGALTPAVERICHKHVSLHIQPDQYKIVGTYLLAAMGEVLGEALTPEILAAWGAAYWQLADIMIGVEAQLYSAWDGWTDWRNFKVVKKVIESETITSFYLSPEDEKPLPKFKPGQYISVQLLIKDFGYLQSRQYSLSDAPRTDYYRISVKRELGTMIDGQETLNDDGMVSNALHEHTQVGDILQVTHPAGEFFLDTSEASQAPVVLLSAGVGATPMMSILTSLIEQNSNRQISYIHAARNTASQAFSKQIHEISQSHDNVHAIIFKSKVVDQDVENIDYHHAVRLDLTKVDAEKDLFITNPGTTYYICGPNTFMTETARYLCGVDVSSDRIKMELFGTGGA